MLIFILTAWWGSAEQRQVSGATVSKERKPKKERPPKLGRQQPKNQELGRRQPRRQPQKKNRRQRCSSRLPAATAAGRSCRTA